MKEQVMILMAMLNHTRVPYEYVHAADSQLEDNEIRLSDGWTIQLTPYADTLFTFTQQHDDGTVTFHHKLDCSTGNLAFTRVREIMRDK